MPKSDNTNTIQTVSHVILAGVALLALFRDDKRVGVALAIVAVAAIVPTYYEPIKSKLRAWGERGHRNPGLFLVCDEAGLPNTI